jgi:anti-sigma factor ChrR (cupin superfamily)
MAELMSLAETKLQLAHYAEMQLHEGERAVKEQRMDDATRCADRVDSVQKEGRLLVGDDESRDPHWMRQHSQLYRSAEHHNLVRYDIK